MCGCTLKERKAEACWKILVAVCCWKMFTKLTEENEGIGKLFGMRHLDVPNFSNFMWCQNDDNFKAGRVKGIHCLQVNKYSWTPLLVLCLALPKVPVGSPQGPSLLWEWAAGFCSPQHCCAQDFAWKCYDKSWIAIQDSVNHCETVEEPLGQSFPPGRTHTWCLSPSCPDLVSSSCCA